MMGKIIRWPARYSVAALLPPIEGELFPLRFSKHRLRRGKPDGERLRKYERIHIRPYSSLFTVYLSLIFLSPSVMVLARAEIDASVSAGDV
ncbi:MAG: hypothetical protein KAG97_09525, partial [Victivallales bacterium]|nr:hypothetical protein [Victivallales bacterium]